MTRRDDEQKGRGGEESRHKGLVISSPRRLLASWLLIFLIWALFLTYPLLLHPFSHIPRGAEPAGTIPFFNLWTLQWNIDQLMQGYPHYWDAPIFAPTAATFAFSEIQPVSALLAAPLWLGLQSPALGYNALIILFLTLNGWFACCLLKSWGASNLAAILTGLIVQSLPFVVQEMGVLQLTAIFGYLWSLFFLTRVLAQSRNRGRFKWRTGFGFALGLPLTFFTCGYYGLFSALFLPLLFLFYLRCLNPKVVKQLVVILLVSVALTLPLVWRQNHILAQNGLTRSVQAIENNSARLVEYTGFLDYNLFYRQLLNLESGSGQRLFPGIALVLLAGLGLFGPANRRIKAYLILATVLAVLLSMGLRLHLGSWQPYQWLLWYVPGFDQLRSPFRFAVIVQIHLALLAGFGLINLERWGASKGKWVGAAWATLILLESLAWPLPLQPMPALQPNTAWREWLNHQSQPVTIVMLPFAASSRAADFEQTTRWMLENRLLEAKTVNGYSGFFPAWHAGLREEMRNFPSHQSVALLNQLEVDYVVIYHTLPQAPSATAVTEFLPSVFTDPSNNISIYALTQP